MAEEDQPGPDWERVTAWMNRKNPNWKRVEPKMKALAVRKARCARRSLQFARISEDLKRAEALGREAVEWSELLRRDPTARERAPEIFKASASYRLHELSFPKTLGPPLKKIPRWMPSPPRPIVMSPPQPPRPPLPPWEEVYEKICKVPEEEDEGLKMILFATLEEIRHVLPPDSNQHRWFEAMLKNKPSS
ncbi:hypothetical protein OROMI_020462 [Orobanche minor]